MSWGEPFAAPFATPSFWSSQPLAMVASAQPSGCRLEVLQPDLANMPPHTRPEADPAATGACFWAKRHSWSRTFPWAAGGRSADSVRFGFRRTAPGHTWLACSGMSPLIAAFVLPMECGALPRRSTSIPMFSDRGALSVRVLGAFSLTCSVELVADLVDESLNPMGFVLPVFSTLVNLRGIRAGVRFDELNEVIPVRAEGRKQVIELIVIKLDVQPSLKHSMAPFWLCHQGCARRCSGAPLDDHW